LPYWTKPYLSMNYRTGACLAEPVRTLPRRTSTYLATPWRG